MTNWKENLEAEIKRLEEKKKEISSEIARFESSRPTIIPTSNPNVVRRVALREPIVTVPPLEDNKSSTKMPNAPFVNFSSELRAKRLAAGMTQLELIILCAKKGHVFKNTSAISKFELGKGVPTKEQLAALESALGNFRYVPVTSQAKKRGRPPGRKYTQKVLLTCSPDQKAKLKALSNLSGESMAKILRKFVDTL